MQRDPDASVQLHFRVREDLRARLDAAARKRSVTMSSEIVRRLEQSFNQTGDIPEASKKIADVLAGVHILNRQLHALKDKMEGSNLQEEVRILLKTLEPLEDHVNEMVQAILRQEFPK